MVHRAEPHEQRKPRSPTAPREKKILRSRYNPNVQVAKSARGPGTQLSTEDDRQPHSERSVAEAAPPGTLDAAAGGAENELDERLRLARFLAAAKVRTL